MASQQRINTLPPLSVSVFTGAKFTFSDGVVQFHNSPASHALAGCSINRRAVIKLLKYPMVTLVLELALIFFLPAPLAMRRVRLDLQCFLSALLSGGGIKILGAWKAVVRCCLIAAKWWSPPSALCLCPCCGLLWVPCLVQPSVSSDKGQWCPSLLGSTHCLLQCLSHLYLLPLTLLVAWLTSWLERFLLPFFPRIPCHYSHLSHGEAELLLSACCRECASFP